MAQQPIEVAGNPDALPSYLKPRAMGPSQKVQPPVLNYGWIVDETHLMDVVRQRFPQSIEIRVGSAEGLKSALSPLTAQTSRSPLVRGESTFATCFSSTLQDDISDYIKVPKRLTKLDLVEFAILWDSQCNKYLGITVGTNYKGVLHANSRSRLCELLDLDESDGKWYLDQRKCYWTPRGMSLTVSCVTRSS